MAHSSIKSDRLSINVLEGECHKSVARALCNTLLHGQVHLDLASAFAASRKPVSTADTSEIPLGWVSNLKTINLVFKEHKHLEFDTRSLRLMNVPVIYKRAVQDAHIGLKTPSFYSFAVPLNENDRLICLLVFKKYPLVLITVRHRV